MTSWSGGRLRLTGRRSMTGAKSVQPGVHRGAAASSRHPAGGVDPPRGSGVLRQGGGRDAADVGAVGQQRAATCAGGGARPHVPRSVGTPAGDAAPAPRRQRSNASSTATSTPCSAMTSACSRRCWLRARPSRCPRWRPGSPGARCDQARGSPQSPTMSGLYRWRAPPARANGCQSRSATTPRRRRWPGAVCPRRRHVPRDSRLRP